MGPEFDDCKGSILVFKKALYGYAYQAMLFELIFADLLRLLGFSASQYDRDAWTHEQDEHDSYNTSAPSHIDNFKIVACNRDCLKEQISAACLLDPHPTTWETTIIFGFRRMLGY